MKRYLQSILIFAVLFLNSVNYAADRKPGYSFFLNGKFFLPDFISLSGNLSSPQETDLIKVNGLLMLLGKAEKKDFRMTKEMPGVLQLKNESGKYISVGVYITRTWRNGKMVVQNPLSNIGNEDFKHIRSVHLDVWNDTVTESLSKLPMEKVCISITGTFGATENQKLPFIPHIKKLRFLTIREPENIVITDFSTLADTESLQLFNFFSPHKPDFDLEWISKNKGLTHLSFDGAQIKNLDLLKNFSKLQVLSLPKCKGLPSPSFFDATPNLRFLDLAHSDVADLSKLSDAQEIQIAIANRTKLSKLPTKTLPKLQVLEMLGTEVKEEAVEAFKKLNPRVHAPYKIKPFFKEIINRADSVKISYTNSWKTIGRPPIQPFTINDQKEMSALLKNIEIDAKKTPTVCPCSESPYFDFYQQQQLLLRIEYRHFGKIEWVDGALGKWPLTDASNKFLNDWITKQEVARGIRPKKVPAKPKPDQLIKE